MLNQPDEEPPLSQEGGMSAEERERLVDDAAALFAQLFLEQYQHNERMCEKNQSPDGDRPGRKTT